MAHNGAEHSLEVESRADRLTNLAQRSKLAHRLRQLARPRFQFLEQPDVFDSNYGLVGEGFQQLDLRRREGAHLNTTRVQCSNEFPLLTKGNGQEGTEPADDT